MAKLYFRYSAMNSGKTTALIQTAYNYEERGMKVVIVKPAIDLKGRDNIVSRLGIKRPVDILVNPRESLTDILNTYGTLHCVLVDEAQFLTSDQVEQLFWFAADTNVPVIAYGLRTDFQTVGFPGASRMLEIAHEIQEIKTICRCGKKAIFNGRKRNGEFVAKGNQVAIDGTDKVEYESLCANCYKQLVKDKQ